MSMLQTVEVTCPECSVTQKMSVWTSVNVKADPHLRDEVLEQRLNVFSCGQQGCDYRCPLDISVLYHDMDGKFCVQYVAKEDMKNPNYYRHLSKQGVVMVPHLAAQMMEKTGGHYIRRPHHVFSMKEMLLYILFRQFCEAYGRDAGDEPSDDGAEGG
ncbi:CpXC domain-containing protein [Prosthecobacter sp.]|uniref:CpXC domain-containing protein n=1 Tax=Prosthecobacter sp. TaxID=1965333 RepID=UPI003784272D